MILKAPNPRIIDWQENLRIANQDANLCEKLLEMLFDSLDEYIQEIQIAYSQNDTKQLEEIAHRLKGGFKYCSVPELESAITDVGHASQSGNMQNTIPAIKRFLKACENFRREYKSIC